MHLYEEFKEYEHLWEDASKRKTANNLSGNLDDEILQCLVPILTRIATAPGVVLLPGGALMLADYAVFIFDYIYIAAAGIRRVWSDTGIHTETRPPFDDNKFQALEPKLEQIFRTIDLKKYKRDPEVSEKMQALSNAIRGKDINRILDYFTDDMHKHPKQYIKIVKTLQQKELYKIVRKNKKHVLTQLATQTQAAIKNATNNVKNTDGLSEDLDYTPETSSTSLTEDLSDFVINSVIFLLFGGVLGIVLSVAGLYFFGASLFAIQVLAVSTILTIVMGVIGSHLGWSEGSGWSSDGLSFGSNRGLVWSSLSRDSLSGKPLLEALDDALNDPEFNSNEEQFYRTVDLRKTANEDANSVESIKALSSKAGQKFTDFVIDTLEEDMHKHPKRWVKIEKKLYKKFLKKEARAQFKANKKQISTQVTKAALKMLDTEQSSVASPESTEKEDN